MHQRNVLWGILSGVVGGVAAFLYARIFVEPHVQSAIAYEDGRGHVMSTLDGTHDHEHELFSRSIQENIGAGVGTVVFGIAMGAFFGVALTLLLGYFRRQQPATDPRWVAAAVAAILFVAIYIAPTAVYPANPPSVGVADTIGARSASFLTITVVSVVTALAATVVALVLRQRLGGFFSAAVGLVSYVVVIGIAATLLPSFDEVPTPLTNAQGQFAFPGFPADTLAEFRLQSLGAQAVLWLLIAATFATLTTIARRRATRSTQPADALVTTAHRIN